LELVRPHAPLVRGHRALEEIFQLFAVEDVALAKRTLERATLESLARKQAEANKPERSHLRGVREVNYR